MRASYLPQLLQYQKSLTTPRIFACWREKERITGILLLGIVRGGRVWGRAPARWRRPDEMGEEQAGARSEIVFLARVGVEGQHSEVDGDRVCAVGKGLLVAR